jgi:hypothetical protein
MTITIVNPLAWRTPDKPASAAKIAKLATER